jgi:transposase
MIDQRTIFEIHRLAHEGFSVRKIAKTLGLSRPTTSQYLADPAPPRPRRPRPSPLDPFKDMSPPLLESDPKVSAVVLRQRLAEHGFTGGMTSVRQYLTRVRPAAAQKRPVIRFESAPGVQCQIDWGHFGSITYGATARKLYCLAVIACHSRRLYLEFTHSQRQDTLHRCLLNAFHFFQGTPQERVHDHMLTAGLERPGPLVRFNEHFLAFLRPFQITPIACNVAQPQEKGKVEQGAIHYIRHNFWPLRTFRDLTELQAQANQWRAQVANVRVHATTGEPPIQRFDPQAMRPLPALVPACRDTAQAKVHTAFSIRFDGHPYTVPPWLIGNAITVKADHHQVTCYFKDKPVATHFRGWQRKQRIALPQHREAAHKHHRRYWYSQEVAALISFGEIAQGYLEHLATTNEPRAQQVKTLLALKDDYGTQALLDAMQRAMLHQAFGAHYIDNILDQAMTPQRQHPPVRLKQAHLNQSRLEEPTLADYEAFVLKRPRA